MPKLDQRLSVVANHICSDTHADIGSDHGHLLVSLLTSGRIRYGIAIENKRAPFENSRRALADYHASVRLADGLAGLDPGEADSLSLCGMGGHRVVRILSQFPDRIPDRLIVQANDHVGEVRRWGLLSGFQLVDESLIAGKRHYVVIEFCRTRLRGRDNASKGCGGDAAYDDLDREVAFEFGPHLIRRWEKHFVERLEEEQTYLSKLPGLTERSQQRLELLMRLFAGRRN